MKQFNLTEYLRLKEEGKEPKIVARDGSSVRMLCTDRDSNDGYPVVALVKIGSGEHESVINYRPDGTWFNDETKYDLFFAPAKYEAWVNIYRDVVGTRTLGGVLHPTEKEARDAAKGHVGYVTTVKIEWTE